MATETIAPGRPSLFVWIMAGEDGDLAITPVLSIPWRELTFRATPAGGPGGQHVNRSSTRVELWWDVLGSPSLDEGQRGLLRAKLAPRLDQRGVLRLVSAEHRSQARNREAVVERFIKVIANGLKVPRPRKPTRPTRASVARRLDAKRKRSERKRERGRREGDE
jgi:ribosome-associated protein